MKFHLSKATNIFLKRLFFTFSFLILSGVYIRTFAIGSPYQPGSTLDPACVPGEVNCFVQIIPDQTGHNGEFLVTDGSTTRWSSALSGSALRWYMEPASAPSVSPIVTGSSSIAIGDGAQALAAGMFVYGSLAGESATGASNSNFIGMRAGVDATNAYNSNFIGQDAGGKQILDADDPSPRLAATNAYASNFFGYYTGLGATNANDSNFFGEYAGALATDANNSNFFGQNAGNGAVNAADANFFGEYAGSDAQNASFSNFIGYHAGSGALNASQSNLIGFQAGAYFLGNNIGANNIIIGSNISLPDSTSDSMNIGGVLFGTGLHSAIWNNPSITPEAGGKIGIGVISPTATLDVGGSVKFTGDGSGPVIAANTSSGYTGSFYDLLEYNSRPLITVYGGSNVNGNGDHIYIGSRNANWTGSDISSKSSYGIIAIGKSVLTSVTNSSPSFGTIGIGLSSLNLMQTGNYNIGIGTWALEYLTTGHYNTAVGTDAGGALSTGSSNTYIGYNAGHGSNQTTTHNNVIALGYRAQWFPSSPASVSNTTVIGTSLNTSLSNVVVLGRSDQNILLGQSAIDSGARLQVLKGNTNQILTSHVAEFSNTGATFDTTSGVLSSYGGYFSSTSTRSAGANALTNIGLYATASGGQYNYAAIFDQGNVGIGTTTPTAKLDIVGDVKSSGIITGQNLTITGVTSDAIPAPTGASATINYGQTSYYEAYGNSISYRVYSYKITPSGSRIYSSTYSESNTVTDNNSTNSYTVTVSWTPAAGVDGYRVLLNDPNWNGYTYDAGYDLTASSFTDDSCNVVCFRSSKATVTPTGYYTNNATINGSAVINGSLTLSDPLYVRGMTFSADDNLNITLGTGNGNLNNANGYPSRGVLIGIDAGNSATYAESSIFVGWNAGASATNASYSNFTGVSAGQSATNATYSNFFGAAAGSSATNAAYSNFFGSSAGTGATGASNSNFIGRFAGNGASSAPNSNFFGDQAGRTATNAAYSNFIGSDTGFGAINASYSNLFGFSAGKYFSGNNIGSNNIIIGTNISLPNAATNSMNIGAVLFGTGLYSTTTGNPSITPISGGKIGIGIASPLYTLDVNGTARIGSSSITDGTALLRLEDANSTCDFTANSGSPSCGSDMTLKKDIVSLNTNDILTKVASLNPVSYHWNTQSDTDSLNYGFIAQEVQAQFPDLVHEGEWIDGSTRLFLNTGGLMPYVVGAIKEMNIKIEGFGSLDTNNPQSMGTIIKSFLADVGNTVSDLYASVIHSDKVETKTLCVGSVCVSEQQFLEMVSKTTTVSSPTPEVPSTESSPSDKPAPEVTPTDTITTSSNEQAQVPNADSSSNNETNTNVEQTQ